MTDTDIVTRLAREAGMDDIFRDGTRWQAGDCMPSVDRAQLARLIALVAEECAKVCARADKSTHPADLADTIRAKFKEPM